MEKKDRPYAVVPYDPKWAKRYEQERKIIANIFKEKAQNIEHIGSTSVRGMWAKPQIDILVLVDDLRTVDGLISEMESSGYSFQKDFNKYNERYFTRDAPSGERLISIHVKRSDDTEAQSYLYLRDYLREHPQERDLYSRVKRVAYESGANRAEYPSKKIETLDAIKERARKWHLENRAK